jgi:hypothetical protein
MNDILPYIIIRLCFLILSRRAGGLFGGGSELSSILLF